MPTARGRVPVAAAAIVARALDGPWRRPELTDRLVAVLAIPDVAEEVADLLLAHFSPVPWGEPGRLAREIATLPGLLDALTPPQPRSARAPGAPGQPEWRWPVAPWTDVGQVAAAMDLTSGELAWFADQGGWLRRSASSTLSHYRYRWWSTRSGGVRLLEAPKPLLAERQRRVLRQVLAHIPAHPAAHGFVPGRSVVSFAAPHAGQAVVVRVDLEGFFTAVTASRVTGVLVTAGYPAPVARVLAGLMTTATPVEVLRRMPSAPGGEQAARRDRQRLALAAPHLPQGAPSSPAAANAVAHGLDRRLAALAAARGMAYTRYADDLAFSGPAGTDTIALRRTIARVVGSEGFRVHPTKTRVMRAHRQQRLAGLVVNTAPAAPRREYDALRAILHNCATTGPEAQNRDQHPDFAAHLRGRIAWITATHPGRGRTLLTLFHRIPWS